LGQADGPVIENFQDLPAVRYGIRKIVQYADGVWKIDGGRSHPLRLDLEREFHIMGGDGHTVVPTQAAAEANRPGLESRRMLTMLGQPSLHLAVAVPSEQRQEHE